MQSQLGKGEYAKLYGLGEYVGGVGQRGCMCL